MPVCEHCDTEFDPFDHHGNEGWVCPNDCEADITIEKIRSEEDAKSDEQLAAEAEDMMDD